jgi:hypothetical protein
VPPRTRYVLTFEDAGGEADPPPEVRLRALLKTALRRDRLRCVEAREENPVEEEDGDGVVPRQ